MYQVKYVLKSDSAISPVQTTLVSTHLFETAVGAVMEMREDYGSKIEFISVTPCRTDLICPRGNYRVIAEVNNGSAI